jgi:hypothetical protein
MTVQIHGHTKVCVVHVCFCFGHLYIGAINPADINRSTSVVIGENKTVCQPKIVASDPLVAPLFHSDGANGND